MSIEWHESDGAQRSEWALISIDFNHWYNLTATQLDTGQIAWSVDYVNASVPATEAKTISFENLDDGKHEYRESQSLEVKHIASDQVNGWEIAKLCAEQAYYGAREGNY